MASPYNAFDSYLRAKRAAMVEGNAMLQMERFVQQQRRDRGVRNILSEAYRPGTPEIPRYGPTPSGEALSPIPETPGRLDWQNAMRLGAEQDLIPEILKARAALPKKERDKWKLAEIGAGGNMRQRIAFREDDPTKTKTFGEPYPPRAGMGESKPFGGSLVGLATSVLSRNALKERQGQPLTEREKLEEQAAKHLLTQERIMVGPSGERMVFTPGLPPFARERQPTQPQVQPQAETTTPDAVVTPGGGQVVSILEKPVVSAQDRKRIQASYDVIDSMVDLLNEAQTAGEDITGVRGTAKRKAGGLLRQAGVDVSPRAEQLETKLMTLQGLVGPLILNEKRLSETERERLMQIVGTVGPTQDIVSVTNKIRSLLAFLEFYESEQR